VSGGRVTFEPGARTAWHTHSLGQTLIVTAGSGWTHIAIQEYLDGRNVEWMEKVSDEQYRR
jgi:quercetin dioxygenase-like cupin family protein